MNEPRRILIIRPSALGDVCRSVPVLTSLRRAWPVATIDWLVQDAFAPAIEHHRDLDEVIRFPRRRFAAPWRPAVAREIVRFIRDLRRRRYDVVIDAQGLGRSAGLALLSGAGRRVGAAEAREGGWIAYTTRVRTAGIMHTVDAMLELLTALDVTPVRDMRLDVDPDAEAWWTARRSDTGWDARPYVVLAPTSRWASKRWPIERWVALRDRLLSEQPDAGIVVIGAPGEERQVDPLTTGGATMLMNLVGTASIAESMAVIRQAMVIVANDSAPLHMAVGLDVPCVALFGPTDERRVGPYGRMDSVVRGVARPDDRGVDHKRLEPGSSMMSAITVDAVCDAVARQCAEPCHDGVPRGASRGQDDRE